MKTDRIHIRLSDQERARFEAAASAKGLTLSAWARMVMMEASEPSPTKKTKEPQE